MLIKIYYKVIYKLLENYYRNRQFIIYVAYYSYLGKQTTVLLYCRKAIKKNNCPKILNIVSEAFFQTIISV